MVVILAASLLGSAGVSATDRPWQWGEGNSSSYQQDNREKRDGYRGRYNPWGNGLADDSADEYGDHRFERDRPSRGFSEGSRRPYNADNPEWPSSRSKNRKKDQSYKRPSRDPLHQASPSDRWNSYSLDRYSPANSFNSHINPGIYWGGLDRQPLLEGYRDYISPGSTSQQPLSTEERYPFRR